MPIIKIYEVKCDGCGKLIDTFIGYKPSLQKLRRSSIVKIKNGHTLTWCMSCYKKWQEKHANRE